MREDLTVVVVSHDHGAYLEANLRSLDPARHDIGLEVIVVDNASRDDTCAVVGRHAFARLLRNTRREGFAANSNKGIREARGRHILLLNPDTEVVADAPARLVDFLDMHPRVGFCGPQLVFPDGTLQRSCRSFPDLAWVVARRTPLRLLLPETRAVRAHLMEDFDHTQAATVDWLLGAAIAVRRDFLSSVGLLDEGFFLYVEDIDWAFRARQAGWEVWYVPQARVVHHHQALSDRKLLGRHTWWHTRSMWRYYRKHLAPLVLRLGVEPERLPPASV
jgi:N-acetylglucosaminyl-diphospho-decaprenol L-rhamnosyltransferase